MTWLVWLIIVVIAALVGYDIGRELAEHRLLVSLLRLHERERELERREAEKRVTTTLKVHQATHSRPIYIKPPEQFVRIPWQNS